MRWARGCAPDLVAVRTTRRWRAPGAHRPHHDAHRGALLVRTGHGIRHAGPLQVLVFCLCASLPPGPQRRGITQPWLRHGLVGLVEAVTDLTDDSDIQPP